jgi:hypothetical protein
MRWLARSSSPPAPRRAHGPATGCRCGARRRDAGVLALRRHLRQPARRGVRGHPGGPLRLPADARPADRRLRRAASGGRELQPVRAPRGPGRGRAGRDGAAASRVGERTRWRTPSRRAGRRTRSSRACAPRSASATRRWIASRTRPRRTHTRSSRSRRTWPSTTARSPCTCDCSAWCPPPRCRPRRARRSRCPWPSWRATRAATGSRRGWSSRSRSATGRSSPGPTWAEARCRSGPRGAARSSPGRRTCRSPSPGTRPAPVTGLVLHQYGRDRPGRKLR